RGAQLVHINPLIEPASRRTIVPHEFVNMATFHTTETGTMTVQVRIGGDMALIRGVAKAVLESAEKDPSVLDCEFIEYHTHGFEEYRALVVSTAWTEIVEASGISEADIRKLADTYIASKRVIIAWCLGITQHENGVDTVREIVNLLLLRGNIGREGAGPCPIRGHSNVQGNRTCGINHRPDAAFLDRLGEVCGFTPPREHGLGTVATIEAMRRGEMKVFVALGGNFALAAPDLSYTAEALRNCELTVQVSTKLNRSHIVHGRRARIPNRPAASGARLPDFFGTRRIFAGAAPGRHRPRQGTAFADHNSLSRPIQHHDLLQRRPLPGTQGTANSPVHERRRYEGART